MSPNTPSQRTSLSVVVPMYDEEAAVGPLIDALRALVSRERSAGREIEVVLVDDGSKDGTWAELGRLVRPEDAGWRAIRHDRNRGLTAALRTGTEAARCDSVAWLDADLTYDPAILELLTDQIDRGADIAMASCHHPDGRMLGVPALRRWLSRGASGLYRMATRVPIRTFTCMVRVQRRQLILDTWPDRSGFLGVTEQLLRALQQGARVVEVPAVLRARQTGSSKMRVMKVARAHLALVAAARRGLNGRG